MTFDFNITNFCNAKCPTCKRFNLDNYLQVEKNLKVVHMSFEDFKTLVKRNKKTFTNGICTFCGEFGDPLMHPNIKEFTELAGNVFKMVCIFTNGGLNRKSFFDYVISSNKNIVIRFGIDGLTHETNNKYRINVNTELAYNNMFLLANHSKAWWDYTVFEHNQHEIEDVIKLAEQRNLMLFFRCNLRPSVHGVKRISNLDFEKYKSLSEKYKNNYKINFDCSWID
jgi:MoaA/NifB/PqqE/SkfB family radical SAM enzyme